MLITFREITIQDLDTVSEILRRTHFTIWTASTRPADVWKHVWNPEITGYVLEQSNEIVGASFVERPTNMYLKGIAMVQFAVHPARQGRGFGTVLIRQTLKTVADCHRVSLHVVRSNLHAIMLYLREGFMFESVERRGYLGEDQYIMSLIREEK